jgi:hypothetical protein
MGFMLETPWLFVHNGMRRAILDFHSIFTTGLAAKEGAEMSEQINATRFSLRFQGKGASILHSAKASLF